jgi:hypothetical protein
MAWVHEGRGINRASRMKYITLLSIIILSACSPSAKLRRAEKLINKAEQAGLQWHSDTLHSTIEIPIPEIVKDTIFQSKPGIQYLSIKKDYQ